MPRKLVATATITIDASPAEVWRALTDPELVARYMFGTELTTDWEVGSPVVYRGEWEGKPYEDKGIVLEFRPNELLETSHFSPLTGAEDIPENYHTVTYRLEELAPGGTLVTLTQDNNDTPEAAEHSQANWEMALAGLKSVVEET
ncbi:SRPBCC domain-containing protein [Glaciihabitans sp. dw_435]|uniref:SRPBCC family protein n=1 Tax=Glaciihabitans sp. dw_435 TaxID=2720081 RepID=UPI001BD3BFE2|nr:SRPBCC domain-containing protein [Glaciihabitans sp. dw_435]